MEKVTSGSNLSLDSTISPPSDVSRYSFSRYLGVAGSGRRTGLVIIGWLVITAAVSGFLQNYIFDATTAAIFVFFALSVNILFGWTGLPSFGQAAFFGIGAYTAALMGTRGAPLLPMLIAGVGGLVAAIVGSAVILRSSRMGFAMFTLAYAQIFYEIAESSNRLGADSGLTGPARGSILGLSVTGDQAFWWFVALFCLLVTMLLRHAYGSSLGATMRAVRQDPVRAAALGIPVRRLRIIAFAAAGLLAGVAGCLYAQLNGIADPSDDLFWTLSGTVLLLVILGGMYSFWGPAVGAVVYVVAEKYLLAANVNQNLALGAGLLVVFLVMPRGLASVGTAFASASTALASTRAAWRRR
jgi:branched-chain amino acid transport system permease protein